MTTAQREKQAAHPGVYRRGKRFVASVDLGWQPVQRCASCGAKRWLERAPLEVCPCGADLGPATSARRQVWVSKDDEHPDGFTSATAAARARRKAQGAVDDGAFVAPSNETLGTYLAGWLDGSRSRIRPSTLASYRVNIHKHLIPRLGSVRLQSLTPSTVNAFYADLSASGLSAKSVRNIHVILRKALGDAVKWGRLTRNVAALADPPRVVRKEMSVWEASELRQFLDKAREDRLYAAWLLAITTGMRRGEILGARRQDLDLAAGRLSVVQAIVLVDGAPTLSEPKTTRGRRNLALDPATVAALRSHLAKQSADRLAWGEAYKEAGGLLFLREDGSPIHPEWFSNRFKEIATAAGLPSIRLHDLRHSYAVASLAAGVHPKVVSERLGHATVSFTLDVYSHVLPAMDEEAASRVAGLILNS